MVRITLRVWAACALVAGIAGAAQSAAEAPRQRVLLLHSFGRSVSPGEELAMGFRTELQRLSPTLVEFHEATLETARFAETANEGPIVDYLYALFAERRIDLLVAFGAPAARFCLRHRDRLFPATPLLVASAEARLLQDLLPQSNAAAASVALDLPAAIENILQVLPDTDEIVVVLGGSALSRLWLAESQREFERFSPRVRFTWVSNLSLDEVRERLAVLPPRTAIFFEELYLDAAGNIYQQQEALASLHAVANAPIFGLFDIQLGQGIVGGPLLPVSVASREAATSALRILSGEPAEHVEAPPVSASGPAVYDFRELERWGVKESRLPPGSRILFRPPSRWHEYRGPFLIGLGVMALQAVLIAGLLVQRARRRVAEEEARALAGRLLTAHEDERRRLARELHDDLSQRLARLAIDAARIEPRLAASPEAGSGQALRDGLARLSEDVHALSYQLHPSVLDDLGLKEALEVECDRFSRRESMPARLASFEVPKELSREVSVCLFRIAQEALRNAARHSRASRVSLSVAPLEAGVRMTVTDNGVGFDPERRSRHSLGQASMRERAHLVHGRLEVESEPGRGTTVKVSVPLRGAP